MYEHEQLIKFLNSVTTVHSFRGSPLLETALPLMFSDKYLFLQYHLDINSDTV